MKATTNFVVTEEEALNFTRQVLKENLHFGDTLGSVTIEKQSAYDTFSLSRKEVANCNKIFLIKLVRSVAMDVQKGLMTTNARLVESKEWVEAYLRQNSIK